MSILIYIAGAIVLLFLTLVVWASWVRILHRIGKILGPILLALAYAAIPAGAGTFLGFVVDTWLHTEGQAVIMGAILGGMIGITYAIIDTSRRREGPS